MNTADNLGSIKGVFSLQIVCSHTGKILEEYEDKNLVVNGGRTAVMQRLAVSASNKYISKLGVGTNGTAPVGTNTALTGLFVKALGAITYPTISSVRWAWTIGASEANGIGIREFGLICNDNTLFARKTRELINKNADIILNGTWTLSF